MGLVLNRKVGEAIVIAVEGAKPIRVKLASVRSADSVRLFIEAEPEIKIVREELIADQQ